MSGTPSLAVESLLVQPGDRYRPVLEGAALSLQAGEAVGLSGRSGSGKSTLLAAINGLVPWHRPARVEGTVRIGGEAVDDLDPGQRAHLLATVLDRPQSQLFLPTPRHELEAVRALHGPCPLERRIHKALGLAPLLDRPTVSLSSGERQRVALALGFLAVPRPVLLDEPTAHLDREGADAVAELLTETAAAGGSVLLAEQAGWRLGGGCRRWLAMDGGRTAPTAAPVAPSPGPPGPSGSEPVLEARRLEIRRGGRTLLRDADLVLRRGEVVLLTGPNGSGKTTLARALAGLERPAGGTIRRAGRVVPMLPAAGLQLFAATVAEEAELTGARPEEVARVLRRHRMDSLAARAPWTLSRGEQQRLVHAVLDLLRPAAMILDEPGQGLDPESLGELVRLIHRRAAHGRAYLVISHREELAAAAHRRIGLRNGRLEELP